MYQKFCADALIPSHLRSLHLCPHTCCLHLLPTYLCSPHLLSADPRRPHQLPAHPRYPHLLPATPPALHTSACTPPAFRTCLDGSSDVPISGPSWPALSLKSGDISSAVALPVWFLHWKPHSSPEGASGLSIQFCPSGSVERNCGRRLCLWRFRLRERPRAQGPALWSPLAARCDTLS